MNQPMLDSDDFSEISTVIPGQYLYREDNKLYSVLEEFSIKHRYDMYKAVIAEYKNFTQYLEEMGKIKHIC